MADYQSNSSVGYKPNPYWAGTKPGFAGITVRLLENTAALQANLLSGDVDMTPSGIGLSVDQAIALQKSAGDRFRFNYEPQLSYEHIEPNAGNPIFQDQRVREALLRGIDVKAIVDRLFAGHADIARTFINGLDGHYDASIPLYGFDPARARILLDQAGWTPGPDGIRRNAKGDRLSLDFATTSGNRVRELTQQVMQSQWKAIGVEVTIKNQPSRTFFGQLLKHREFSGLVEFAWTGEVDLPPFRLTTPDIPTEANNWGGQNYGGVSDRALDAAVDARNTNSTRRSSRCCGRRCSGSTAASSWPSRSIPRGPRHPASLARRLRGIGQADLRHLLGRQLAPALRRYRLKQPLSRARVRRPPLP